MVGFTAQSAHEQAQNVLATSPVHILRTLRVEAHGSVLEICGRVTSYYHKQLAQEAVRSVAHNVELINSVDVA